MFSLADWVACTDRQSDASFPDNSQLDGKFVCKLVAQFKHLIRHSTCRRLWEGDRDRPRRSSWKHNKRRCFLESFCFSWKSFKVNKFSLTTWTVDAKMFGGFCDRKTFSLKRRHVAAFFFAMNEPARSAAVTRKVPTLDRFLVRTKKRSALRRPSQAVLIQLIDYRKMLINFRYNCK